MKAQLLQVTTERSHSFHIRYEDSSAFSNPWHYHPELELTLVLESNGIRFVGDSIEPFDAGDLVLLGPHLPHYWQNEQRYYAKRSTARAKAIVLRFKMDLWGSGFLNVPEMKPINMLFGKSEKGILFDSSIVPHIEPLLHELLTAVEGKKITLWLQIFELLAATSQYRLLSKTIFANIQPARDSGRMHKVLSYVQDNLSTCLTVAQVASMMNMNTTAFCRYFKQQTNKTFIETLNELRINYACRMLVGSDLDVGQIGFLCGYQNVPHFNFVFKKIVGKNPSQYRNELKPKILQ